MANYQKGDLIDYAIKAVIAHTIASWEVVSGETENAGRVLFAAHIGKLLSSLLG
jgi:hypothetical protein